MRGKAAALALEGQTVAAGALLSLATDEARQLEETKGNQVIEVAIHRLAKDSMQAHIEEDLVGFGEVGGALGVVRQFAAAFLIDLQALEFLSQAEPVLITTLAPFGKVLGPDAGISELGQAGHDLAV